VVKQKLDSRNFIKAYGEIIELKEYSGKIFEVFFDDIGLF